MGPGSTVAVRGLGFAYPGADRPAVSNLSFAVEAGEVFGFLGPSGAGKSTTQKVLIGLLRGYSGEVEVLGRDLRSWRSDYYERIGVSFELPNHYRKLTGLENLEFFRSLYGKASEDPGRLLERVGLGDDADVRVSQYSRGMQQRLTFARALLHGPDLIFLDEPTAGLDPINARRVKDIVADLRTEGRTFFLTTHDMSVAGELCDRVAFIVDGSIALIDSPRELKIKHGERKVRVEYRTGAGASVSEFPLDGLADDARFLRLLKEERIETIHTEEATLEDVFIKTTGRTLR